MMGTNTACAELRTPLSDPVADRTVPHPVGEQAGNGFKEDLNGQVECPGCGQSHPRSYRPAATGLCRACWLDPAKRPGGNPRKREATEMLSAALRILAGVVDRDVTPLIDGGEDQDPGVVLPPLLKAKKLIDTTLKRAGCAQTARVGSSAVAVDLTLATGEKWSPQRVDDRWGPGKAAK